MNIYELKLSTNKRERVAKLRGNKRDFSQAIPKIDAWIKDMTGGIAFLKNEPYISYTYKICEYTIIVCNQEDYFTISILKDSIDYTIVKTR